MSVFFGIIGFGILGVWIFLRRYRKMSESSVRLENLEDQVNKARKRDAAFEDMDTPDSSDTADDLLRHIRKRYGASKED